MKAQSSPLCGLPETLRREPQWVNWVYVTRGGKTTKPPRNPRDPFKGAKANDRSTWATFEDAIRVYSDQRNRLEGVGFMLTPGFLGIDLDYAVSDGRLKPAAQEIVDRFPGYWEFSPSGEGVKGIFLYDGPPPTCNKIKAFDGSKMDVEVYVADRYFTTTGQRLEQSTLDLTDHSSELSKFLSELAELKAKPKSATSQTSRNLEPAHLNVPSTPFEVISLGLERYGSSFQSLISGDNGGTSPSEGDLALCNYLATLTGCNRALMDEVFRGTGRMREKWDKRIKDSTYGGMTLEKAIAGNRHTVFETATAPASPRSEGSTERGGAPFEGWGHPFSLELKELPEFDLSVFGPQAEYLIALAEETETPPGLAATYYQGIQSAIIGGERTAIVQGNWKEAPILWPGALAVPGEGKTPVEKPMTRVLHAEEAFWGERAADRIFKRNDEREFLKVGRDQALAALKKAKGKERKLVLKAEFEEASQALRDCHELHAPQMLFDDSTNEAVFKQLHQNFGLGALITDEVGFLQKQQGRSGGESPNLDLFLTGYEGGRRKNNRIKSGFADIKDTRITLCFCAQPVPVQRLIEDEHLREKGFIDRMLLAWPKSRIGTKTFTSPPVDPRLQTGYDNFIIGLLRRFRGVDGTRPPSRLPLRLSGEALSLALDFRRRCDRQCSERGPFSSISGYVSKMAGKAIRLAALLYQAENDNLTAESTLPAEYMKRGIYVMESYYLPHAPRVFGIEPENLAIENARKILAKVVQKSVSQAARSQLGEWTRIKGDALTSALELLEHRRWIRIIEVKTGRSRPKEIIHFHPDLKARFETL